MVSNSVITASTGPIPSNPQVPILPFPHHSMLLLSNQPSDAIEVTSNPHPLFPLSLTNCLDVHEPLNTQSINHQLPHRFKQTGFHSFHFQRDHRLREECEEWNLITCKSRSLKTPPEASLMVLACFVGYMGRPIVDDELRTLTFHAGLLPHHSSGEEKSDGSTARSSRSRFIRKIVGEQQGLVLRTLVSKLKRFDSMG